MKVLLSWSSGKDSAWVLHLLNRAHPGCVGGLLTTVNESVVRAPPLVIVAFQGLW
jgi:hypothetical protein